MAPVAPKFAIVNGLYMFRSVTGHLMRVQEIPLMTVPAMTMTASLAAVHYMKMELMASALVSTVLQIMFR